MLKINPFYWSAFWIGFYLDRRTRTLYICPLPMLGIKIRYLQEV